VKNKDQNNKPINSNFFSERNFEVDQFKTTNVNVLLNRVKLDKKKTLRKRVLTSFIMISLVGCLALYFIV
tara:strand:+ start:296 stop:505 length:210 start_codon:yes stop_codon:yes gene_type:complete